MLIELNRIYVGSGFEKKILINMRYVKRIESVDPVSEHYGLADSVIVMDDGQEVNLIYTTESYTTIKGKITKVLNKITKRTK